MMAATVPCRSKSRPTLNDCCRRHERENNELKDLLISMKLSINILENIKRLSNDCIEAMESMAGWFQRNDLAAMEMENFRTTLANIKTDLCYWSKKYDSKILFDKTCGNDDKITSIFSTTTYSNKSNHDDDRNEHKPNGGPPDVGNPSTARCHQTPSEDVGRNTVAEASNDDHHTDDQNNSEHSKTSSDCERPLVISEAANNEDEEMGHHHHHHDEEGDGDDRYHQHNDSTGGDILSPTELCEISLDTTSQDFQLNGNDDSCFEGDFLQNKAKNGHNKDGSGHSINETMANMIREENLLKKLKMDNKRSKLISMMEMALEKSMDQRSSAEVGGAHSSAHHSSMATTSFNSIHSRSTSLDPVSSVDSNQHSGSKFYPNKNQCAVSKPLFKCDHKGCEFQTNLRQRLSMHKRRHAGEILYHCDVDGCDYISNYKGNIKIHKKHRHRFQSPAAAGTKNNNNSTASGTKNRNRYMDAGSNQDISDDSQQSQPTNGGQAANHHHHQHHHHHHNNNSNNNDDDEEEEEDEDNVAAAVAAAVVASSAADPSRIPLDNNQCNNVRGRKRSLHSYPENHVDYENVSMSSGDLEPPSGKDLKEPQPMKEYQCKVDGCVYRTKWKQCLTAHEFLHAGIKPFKCDHPGCKYRTNFKSNVNVHKRQHRTNPLHCDMPDCGFSTPWKSSLLTHQRNHQQQQLQQQLKQQTSIPHSLESATKIKEEPQHSSEEMRTATTVTTTATTNRYTRSANVPDSRIKSVTATNGSMIPQSSNDSDDSLLDNLIIDDQDEKMNLDNNIENEADKLAAKKKNNNNNRNCYPYC